MRHRRQQLVCGREVSHGELKKKQLHNSVLRTEQSAFHGRQSVPKVSADSSVRSATLWPLVAALLLVYLLVPAQAQEAPAGFLIVKLGDEAVVTEAAAEYLNGVTEYFRARVPRLAEQPLQGWLANTPDSALAILERQSVEFAYVPAAFYVQYLQTGKRTVTPLAQTPRFGKAFETYSLVAPKTGAKTLADLRGQVVRCAFGQPIAYLKRVVFPPDFQPGRDFRLEAATNLADEMFLMLEGGAPDETPAAALLLDEELYQFFQSDELTWQELRAVWRSQELPRELLVTVGTDWRPADREALFEALLEMENDPEGSELLQLLNSRGFAPVDTTLLNATLIRFNRK